MFYVWEQASYNDRVGNNEQHVTRYCFLINAARGDVVSGNAQIGFSPCPAHNCSDGECENDNQTSDTEEAIRDARARCTLNIIVQEKQIACARRASLPNQPPDQVVIFPLGREFPV
jgi:hypothetical protein